MPENQPVVVPFVPTTITVHLGAPDEPAANVTVPFVDYVKNVVSSEVYPTWEPAALRANALAIISYALNRVYTAYYPSRGYDFDITNTTAMDQKFIYGRNIFENVSQLVDEVFNDYLRRQGFVEPLAAKFCNGTTSTCDGLSQWGSQYQALEGADSIQILRSYYGNDVEVVVNAPVSQPQESYPGTPIREGDRGAFVTVIQTSLNRISQNYPAIPKVTVDGIFGPATTAAVTAFQAVFDLVPDGIVGRATWYQLVRLYVAVTKLAELQSEGQQFASVSFQYPDALRQGDTGIGVQVLQYMLSVIGEFLIQIPQIAQNGTFDQATRNALAAFQTYVGLEPTGILDEETWNDLYAQFASIEGEVFQNGDLFPYDQLQPVFAPAGEQSPRYENSTRMMQYPGEVLSLGSSDGEVTV